MRTKAQYTGIMYLRLSSEDKEKAVESNSIKNQRQLILEFLKKHPEIRLIGEKVDDGYSGVNFDRPGFQEMMEEIRSGRCNCVIVKDLSRFARNFIESGKYLQQFSRFSASDLLPSMIITTVRIPTFRRTIFISH